MRNPDRITVILGALEQAWRKQPDLRLTQLLWICLHNRTFHQTNPLFYVEDDETLEGIKSFISACAETDKE